MLGLSFRNRCGLRPSEFAAIGRRAEEAGFEHLVVTEWFNDSVACAVAIGAATRYAQVWTGIANVGLRHPVLMASAAAVADDVSGGRFVLGLGTGNQWLGGEDLDTLAAKPLATMREYVAVVRAALADERVDHPGPRFPASGAHRSFLPRRTDMPVYLAALGPRMIELAGEIADGAYVHMLGPPEIASVRERIAAGARRAGRDPGACKLAALLMVCQDDDVDAARDESRRAVVGYLGYDSYQRHVTRLGYGDALPEIAACLGRGDVERAARLVPDGLVDRVTAHGPVAACRARIDALRDAGAEIVILSARPVRGRSAAEPGPARWRAMYERTIERFAPGVDVGDAGIERYWSDACRRLGLDPGRYHEARTFADPELAGADVVDGLVAAVIAGKKRGTAPCEVGLAYKGLREPAAGDHWIIRDSAGRPRCIVNVTRVERTRFDRVDEAWAAREGEADGSLEYWAAMHRWWYRRIYRAAGAQWTEQAPVLLVYFDLVPGSAV